MQTLSIIYGIHAVSAAIKNNSAAIAEIYFCKDRADKRLSALIDLAKKNKNICHFVDSKTVADIAGNNHHQGVVAKITSTQNYSESDLFTILENLKKPAFLLILDGVQDPHNLGAILRTADAAGINAVIAPKDNAVSITPVVRKVASGAAELVPFFQVSNLARTLQKLEKLGIWIYGLDEAGDNSIYATDLSGPIAIVMGAEGSGLRRLTKKHCDALLNIPMQGSVESLNVSVATGVVLFEALRQRNS